MWISGAASPWVRRCLSRLRRRLRSIQAGERAYCEFRDGRLTGGFFHGTPKTGGALVVLYSDDLAATQAAVEREGGRVVKPVFDFPGGKRFHFLDPDGYEWAAWTAA